MGAVRTLQRIVLPMRHMLEADCSTATGHTRRDGEHSPDNESFGSVRTDSKPQRSSLNSMETALSFPP